MAKYRVRGADGAYPFTADVDLTTAQYKFVTPASLVDRVKLGTGASNPGPLGVLQNSPSAGEGAKVMVDGFTKLKGRAATCNLVYGRPFVCASDGFAEAPATTNGSPVKGIWMGDTISSGSGIGQAFLFPSTTCHIAHS